MSKVSGTFDPAISETTKFVTDVAFDTLSGLKFDSVKEKLKKNEFLKIPKGFKHRLALHGAARFFNKITFNQVKFLRNWKETSGSKLIKTLNFDKIADGILGVVKGKTQTIQVQKAQTEEVKGLCENVKKYYRKCADNVCGMLKDVTGVKQFGKEIDDLTKLVLTIVVKNSDPDKPNINDNALTRIFQIVGTVYQGNENIKNFVDAAKKTFFDVIFSKEFINDFFEGHKHLPKVANFVVGAFHVRKIVDKVLDKFILNNPKNNLNKLGNVKTTYQLLLQHGLNSFFDLGGKKLNKIELQIFLKELPEEEQIFCGKLKEQGFWMQNVLAVSKALCESVTKSVLPCITEGLNNYKYTIKENKDATFKEKLKSLGGIYKKCIIDCVKENAQSKIKDFKDKIGDLINGVYSGIKEVMDNTKQVASEVIDGAKEIVEKAVETGQQVIDGTAEAIKMLNPNGDESKPGMLDEKNIGKVFERSPEGLATIPEVAEQMELPQEQKKTIQSIEEYHDIFDEIEEQKNEIKLQKMKNQKEGLATIPEVAEQMIVEEDSIAGLADFPEVVQEMESRIYLPELQYAVKYSPIDLDNISAGIKSAKIEDKNPIQDNGYTWTANYPLNLEFKKDLMQGDRITFQINNETIEFNENVKDLAKDKIVAAHNKLVDNNKMADATNAFTEISKIANKDTILKLLPKLFKDICEKQGLKLADGKEHIEGNIQYKININQKDPLKVNYEISYPLITDPNKDSKGVLKEVGTLKITFNTEYETLQKNGRRGWTRTYELQSIEDLKIEISEKQKQEIEDDQFTV